MKRFLSAVWIQLFRTSRISFGGTAAVVTSMALISGLSAADATKSIIVSALLIAALADNLTDALSIHTFQESEQLNQKYAFIGTITNFITRLLLTISFVFLVGLSPLEHVAKVTIAWGMLLLATLTYLVAHERKVKPMLEIVKHLLIASAIIIASNLIPTWIGALLG
ncbi:hypothetical protein [Nitrosomonas communis]|uniref:hypothetical protein n=1 Tax=Nitrosomonas communis TaxID=44574 RepID=UPI0015A7102D|nr:hypothetical protein [Nitrosomonas communis]